MSFFSLGVGDYNPVDDRAIMKRDLDTVLEAFDNGPSDRKFTDDSGSSQFVDEATPSLPRNFVVDSESDEEDADDVSVEAESGGHGSTPRGFNALDDLPSAVTGGDADDSTGDSYDSESSEEEVGETPATPTADSSAETSGKEAELKGESEGKAESEGSDRPTLAKKPTVPLIPLTQDNGSKNPLSRRIASRELMLGGKVSDGLSRTSPYTSPRLNVSSPAEMAKVDTQKRLQRARLSRRPLGRFATVQPRRAGTNTLRLRRKPSQLEIRKELNLDNLKNTGMKRSVSSGDVDAVVHRHARVNPLPGGMFNRSKTALPNKATKAPLARLRAIPERNYSLQKSMSPSGSDALSFLISPRSKLQMALKRTKSVESVRENGMGKGRGALGNVLRVTTTIEGVETVAMYDARVCVCAWRSACICCIWHHAYLAVNLWSLLIPASRLGRTNARRSSAEIWISKCN